MNVLKLVLKREKWVPIKVHPGYTISVKSLSPRADSKSKLHFTTCQLFNSCSITWKKITFESREQGRSK